MKAELTARLARAISEDDIAMIYRCRAALRGDSDAVASYVAVTEMELAMRPRAQAVRP